MGNFYANYTVTGASQKAVADAFSGRRAYVTPEDRGCVVVYDEMSDMMNSVDEGLAAKLSADLSCTVLGVSNHDDDILIYQLFRNGRKTDEYNSCPDYFDDGGGQASPSGGQAGVLCQAFESEAIAEVAEILNHSGALEDDHGGEDGPRYVFAVERHGELVRALGISEYAVGFGYRYVSQDELPAGLAVADLTSTQ